MIAKLETIWQTVIKEFWPVIVNIVAKAGKPSSPAPVTLGIGFMRATFLNCPIDLLTAEETVERAASAMRNRQRLQHVALNVAKFVNMQTDPVLRADVAGSDIVGIDGMGIVVAARLLGLP